MNINDAFPSKFIKAADLNRQDQTVTIDRIELDQIGEDQETLPVLYFRDRKRGLVLNKTNTWTIGDLHGPEMDNWPGKDITLFPTQTDFGGKQVPCIRVRIDTGNALSAQAPVDDDGAPPIDDDIQW